MVSPFPEKVNRQKKQKYDKSIILLNFANYMLLWCVFLKKDKENE